MLPADSPTPRDRLGAGDGIATLEYALEIAREVHAGQVDKGGQPVIDHVLRVVAAVQTPAEKKIAALHDVIEDAGSPWTLQRLADAGFSMSVLNAVADITRPTNASYRDYINHLARYGSTLARTVKIADLRDHLAPERVGNLTPSHRRRYERSLVTLGAPPTTEGLTP